MKPDARILELCERLTSPGPINGKLSASEFHEMVEFIHECDSEEAQNPADPVWGYDTCNHCKRPLYLRNLYVADGCPCNSGRGINHGKVPGFVCTCLTCDPAQTGSTRKPFQQVPPCNPCVMYPCPVCGCNVEPEVPDRFTFYIGSACVVCKDVFKNTIHQRILGWQFVTKQIALCPACLKERNA